MLSFVLLSISHELVHWNVNAYLELFEALNDFPVVSKLLDFARTQVNLTRLSLANFATLKDSSHTMN